MGVTLVIRLNKAAYDRKKFINKGIKHLDLQFVDGTAPPDDIAERFMQEVEKEKGAVAIHCKAGLGRTGSLICLYAMKHFGFPAAPFIGWIRVARPGSILGPQQNFLNQVESRYMALGGASKRGELTTFSNQSMTNQMGNMKIEQKQDLSTMTAKEK